MEIAGYEGSQPSVETNGTKTDCLAFVLKILKVYFQLLSGYFVCENLDGQLIDAFEISLHS
jgi:hypothetical protein